MIGNAVSWRLYWSSCGQDTLSYNSYQSDISRAARTQHSHLFCTEMQNTPFFSDTKWCMLISYGASFTFLVKLNCSKYRILRKSHIVIRSMTFDLSIHGLYRFWCNNVQYQTIVIKKQNLKPVRIPKVHRNIYLAISSINTTECVGYFD